MPGLLDLPRELIELIFSFIEFVCASWWEDEPASKFTAPVSRLTSKCIEGATRRRFIDRFFNTWHIKAADDQSIQRFCNIVNTSDLLVRGLRGLAVYADDDQMIAKRLGNFRPHDAILQDDEATHVLDEATEAMVPLAYFKSELNSSKASQACQR